MMTDMKELYESIKDDPARCREEAKCLFLPDNPVAQQNQGIRFLTRAVKLHDPEAMYIMGSLFLEHRLRPLQGDPEEMGRQLIDEALSKGYDPNE